MMTLALINTPTEPANDGRDAATSTTVNLLAPRERVRGLVASRLFGDITTPTRIGHFELIRELGAGGMGVVYAAHDPRLDRAVALKVLARAGDGPDASRRLLREAQAMARLKHPNVVPVYEVGTHGDQVFVAMELVDGGTLAEWMDAGPRPWRQVLEILLPAGRGLAAAHAAGLVHRDFKPANVLLDADGRARVTDFGLARGGADPSPQAPLEQAQVTSDIGRALVDTPLTRTGALLGTPAYMAPEQFRGEMATARSDIFAFCVVFWEAIYGRRPFLGHTISEIITAIERGTISPPPRGVHAPGWLRRLLTRGLSSRPGERFASMNELLAALERGDRSSVGRAAAVAAGAALAAVAAAVTAAFVLTSEAPPPPAAAPTDSLADAAEALRDAREAIVALKALEAPTPPELSTPPIACDGDTCTIPREAFRLALAPESATDGLRIIPAFKDGENLGLRIYGLRSGHILKLLGFKNGDTLVDFDGAALTRPASWEPAMNAAAEDDTVVIRFTRKGEAHQRTLRLIAAPTPPAPPAPPAPPEPPTPPSPPAPPSPPIDPGHAPEPSTP